MQLALLRPDAHGDGPADDEPELFVVVLVLRHRGVRLKVHDGKRHPLAGYRSRVDSLTKDVRPDPMKLEKGAHRRARAGRTFIRLPGR